MRAPGSSETTSSAGDDLCCASRRAGELVPTNPDRKLLSVNEVCEELQISRSTLYEWRMGLLHG
ncbi:phBC6A51 family helix-turn-helix protein [Lentzea flava]|uniref:phBC6A51 family helix-turn-helix protein n=1 Tax=Lentzea flava TaxID=103732 RepID=UPI0034D5F082